MKRPYLARAKPEELEAVALIDWAKLCRYRTRSLHEWLIHIPNERGHGRTDGERERSRVQRLILSAMGVRTGVSDYVLAIPMRPHCGLWLELKHGRNRPTEDQLAFLTQMQVEGYRAEWAVGAGEAAAVITDYLAPLGDQIRLAPVP